MGRYVTVGKSSTNDVRVDDDRVSRQHAVLFPGGEGWRLYDLGSTNGTYVNGKRVRAATVAATDVVTLGPAYRLDLRAVQSASAGVGDRPGFLRVGKAADNDLVLDESHVSRHHALLQRDGEGAKVYDAESLNGTFVDGQRVDMAPITPASTIGFSTARTVSGRDVIDRMSPPPPPSRREPKTGQTTIVKEMKDQLVELIDVNRRQDESMHRIAFGGGVAIAVLGVAAYLLFGTGQRQNEDLVETMETMRGAVVMVRTHSPPAGGGESAAPPSSGPIAIDEIEVHSASGEAGSQGSGFIYSHEGRPVVITNHHVVAPWLAARSRGARLLILTQGETRAYPAEVLKDDPENDVAVLGFTGTPPASPKVALQADWSAVRVGDPIGFMSFPLGLSARTQQLHADLNTGIINNKDANTVKHNVESAPGASGGPMFNRTGQVIAINRAQSRDEKGQLYQGLNWGVPIHYAVALLREL